ncbi:MAG: hypothetical protein Q8O14_05740 [bacterium]|jgi:hypothetical protein|nr:hypothetical protein [bacterium]
MRLTRVFLVALVAALAPIAHGAQSHFFKDITVQAGDTLDGDLSVYRGKLIVWGTVRGNVAVMFGDCRIEEGGAVLGNLVVVQGGLELHDPAQITGRISQRDFLESAARDGSSPFAMESVPLSSESSSSSETEVETTRTWESEDTDLHLSFNRVAGLQIGLALPSGRRPVSIKDLVDLNGYAAWAFGTKRPEWKLKLRRKLLHNGRFYLAAGMHRYTDTQDGWMLSSTENSLSGWLLKLDFHDFYDNRGYMAETGSFLFKDRLQVNVGAFREHYGPLDVGTQWNWSGNDSPYRLNLYSDSTGYPTSQNQGVRVGLDLYMWKATRHEDAWAKRAGLTINYERGLEGSGHDYAYERILANIRFGMPFGARHREHFGGRILAGNQSGRLPAHYLFRLGGPDALPGYRPKSIDLVGKDDSFDRMSPTLVGGSSMVLASIENRFSGDLFNIWPLSSFDLLLMADLGQVVAGGIRDMTKAGFRSDFGIGIADEDDDFRLALFRATDSGEADWRLLCRIQRRF